MKAKQPPPAPSDVTKATVRNFASDLIERARAKADPTLHQDAAPLGYRLRGASTLRRTPDGHIQWVKTERERDPTVLLEAFRGALAMKPLPAAKRTARTGGSGGKALNTHRLAIYPMGDPHFGMLSWPEETGEDFNLTIARETLGQAVHNLVGLAPACKHAVLINLGDFLHSDGFGARTERSGHALDVDSRYPKMLRCAVWTLIEAVRTALTKHEHVTVINATGNHDDRSAIMLSVCLEAHFASEPRVKVDNSPAAFHWYEFGMNLIGVTHGHTVKPAALPGIMATDKPEAWGRTKHRFWYTGHLHHEIKKEFPGAIVETFRTLAAKDAWAHAGGYRAGRSMVCDVLHADHGRVLRHEVGVEAL